MGFDFEIVGLNMSTLLQSAALAPLVKDAIKSAVVASVTGEEDVAVRMTEAKVEVTVMPTMDANPFLIYEKLREFHADGIISVRSEILAGLKLAVEAIAGIGETTTGSPIAFRLSNRAIRRSTTTVTSTAQDVELAPASSASHTFQSSIVFICAAAALL